MFKFPRRKIKIQKSDIDHMDYIDIHCHILPGIDDGARDLDEALALARQAVSNGLSDIIATPHLNRHLFKFSLENVNSALIKLRSAIRVAKIPIKIHLGAEIYIAPDIMEGIQAKIIPTLANSKYILLEFPFDSEPPFAKELIFQLQLSDVIPILAHPERNASFQREPSRIEAFVSAGCLVQLNSGSITGHLGRSSQKAAIDFLKNGWVNFIGSDGHQVGGRGINIADAVTAAASIVGVTEAQKLVRDSPRMILESVKATSENDIKEKL